MVAAVVVVMVVFGKRNVCVCLYVYVCKLYVRCALHVNVCIRRGFGAGGYGGEWWGGAGGGGDESRLLGVVFVDRV